jgi:lipopolysaccharide transport system permease protein
MSSINKNKWDLIIQKDNKLWDLQLKAVWNYRELLFMFVKRDFVSFYKQTILGPLWFFIQPLFTTIIYTFVFGGLANLSSEGVPKPLFYMAGITAWNYFSDCITKTSTVFKDNANIFGKVYFPRLIMPLSIVVSNLVRFGVQFVLLILILFYYSFNGLQINYQFIFLIPFLVALMAILGLGVGLIINSLTTKYRDLAFLLIFGIQLLMYTTTVIYPLSSAPAKYKYLIELNPMTGIIEAFRFCLFGKGEVSFDLMSYSVLFTFISLILGVVIFNKTEKTFVDTI